MLVLVGGLRWWQLVLVFIFGSSLCWWQLVFVFIGGSSLCWRQLVLVLVGGRPLLVPASTDLRWGQLGGSSSVVATSAGLGWWQLFVGGDSQAALVVFRMRCHSFLFFRSSLNKAVAAGFCCI